MSFLFQILYISKEKILNAVGFKQEKKVHDVWVGIAKVLMMFLIGIFNTILCLIAFYFVYKCWYISKNIFLDFISACCCSLCYIAYRLAVPCIENNYGGELN
jgi:hypothetical protein